MMPLLSIEKSFVKAVETGLADLYMADPARWSGAAPTRWPDVRPKRQTLRLPRRDGQVPKAGQTLYLYAGPYNQDRRKLGEVECLSVEEVFVSWACFRIEDGPLVLAGGAGDSRECLEFARADGFESWGELTQYLTDGGGLPFYGLLIRW
jgi:hypothetical protein